MPCTHWRLITLCPVLTGDWSSIFLIVGQDDYAVYIMDLISSPDLLGTDTVLLPLCLPLHPRGNTCMWADCICKVSLQVWMLPGYIWTRIVMVQIYPGNSYCRLQFHCVANIVTGHRVMHLYVMIQGIKAGVNAQIKYTLYSLKCFTF